MHFPCPVVPQDKCALFMLSLILRRCVPALFVLGREGTHREDTLQRSVWITL